MMASARAGEKAIGKRTVVGKPAHFAAWLGTGFNTTVAVTSNVNQPPGGVSGPVPSGPGPSFPSAAAPSRVSAGLASAASDEGTSTSAFGAASAVAPAAPL